MSEWALSAVPLKTAAAPAAAHKMEIDLKVGVSFQVSDWHFMGYLYLKSSLLKMIDCIHLIKTAVKAMICYYITER